jgi:uncharacterized membrane protein YgaE (UPF0421/DUF939 family)
MVFTDNVIVAIIAFAILFSIGLLAWFKLDHDFGGLLIVVGLGIGIMGVITGTKIDTKIKYYERKLDHNSYLINKTQRYCAQLNYSAETCNNRTVLYKLKMKQEQLNRLLSEQIMLKLEKEDE